MLLLQFGRYIMLVSVSAASSVKIRNNLIASRIKSESGLTVNSIAVILGNC